MRVRFPASHFAVCVLAALTTTVDAAAADPPNAEDQALATTLFRDAKALLDAGRLSEACAKLEESQRLDPGGGTLLNLAVCHEREGRSATAWAEFRQARVIAERDRRDDRVQLADEHAGALEPKLSKLTIDVAGIADLPDMEILLDQHPVRRPAWGTPLPVDPGLHAIEARAPGKKTWRTEVRLQADADAKIVSLPTWEKDATPPSTRDRTPALVVGGVGVAGIVVGSIFGIRAIKKHDDSTAACTTNPCGADSVSANDAAKTAADLSTVAVAVGLVGLGVGAYLWFSGAATAPATRHVRVIPFGLSGAF